MQSGFISHYIPISLPTQVIKRFDSKADVLNKKCDRQRECYFVTFKMCHFEQVRLCVSHIRVYARGGCVLLCESRPGSLTCFALTQCPVLHLPLKE